MSTIKKLIPKALYSVRIMPQSINLLNTPMEFEIKEMADIKITLNKTKSQMDKYMLDTSIKDGLSVGAQFARVMDAIRINKGLNWYVRNKLNAQSVTRAWLKFYELICHFKLLNGRASPFVFLNAELPGAGICALNHYVKTQLRCPYDWRASSLVNPADLSAIDIADKSDTKTLIISESTALEDKYKIWQLNRQNWLMHSKNDGDATNMNNIMDWRARIGGQVDLYTHDAGIFVDDDPNMQEIKNAKVHLGCALAGLMTLKKENGTARGGNFLAKQYTFFEPFTISLIYIYASAFEEFYICKPITSGFANSEIYLIGINFRGLAPDAEKMLQLRLSGAFSIGSFMSKDSIITHKSWPQLLGAAKHLADQQITYLNESIELYNKYGNNIKSLHKGLYSANDEFVQIYLRANPIAPIRSTDLIASVGSQ
jgi:hypothetical protein